MPIYEYECEGCHKVHELMQKLSDAPLGACPDCGKPVHKIMSRTSFALKGTGWYSTDYKKSAAPPMTSPDLSASDSKSTSDSKSASYSKSGSDSKAASGGSSQTSAAPLTSDPRKVASPATVAPTAPASSATSAKTS